MLVSLAKFCATKNEDDFLFLKSCVIKPSTSDFSSYNTRTTRETGQSLKAKSKVYYRSLINKTPVDPSTMLTAMCDLEKISKDASLSFSIITYDKQLFQVMLDVICANPPCWIGLVLRIGGMHWVTSFAGNVGNLMENCGLAQLMMSSFAGEEKMLTGKKFPINICPLRFVVVELLCGHMEGMLKYHDLLKFLDDVSAKSNLAKHWVRNLIKSVLLMMLYVRAEREGQFALHLDVCKRMLPYFFAASHWRYARDGVAYVQMMENLPDVLNPLIKGEHIVRLQDGLWNAIWTDMAIESTYMRMEKGPSSLIGVRTQESTVKVWANGRHLCNELLLGL